MTLFELYLRVGADVIVNIRQVFWGVAEESSDFMAFNSLPAADGFLA